MRGLTPFSATVALTILLSLPACEPTTPGPYRVVNYGEMSVGSSGQWEPSSAALPGDKAEKLCAAFPRDTGDPQLFLSWNAGSQRTLSCAASELGRAGCDSDAAALSLEDACPSRFAAHSNDNVSMRLRDGRVVTVFQTLQRYCPGRHVHPSMPYAEAMFDEWGNDDERCEKNMKGESCGAGDMCVENCAELTAFDMNDSSVICHPADGETCAPYYEQALYYTRVSKDCGTTWHPSPLPARELKYIDGTPFTAPDPFLGEAGPVVAMDRVEAYADPFSDNAYLTTNVGPWGGNNIALFLHAAVPLGQTSVDWRVLFQHDGASPTVMTSMPHDGGVSRVYWFNCAGGKPKLYFADNPWERPPGASPQAYNLALALSKAEGGAESEYACGYLPGGGEGTTFYTRNFGPTMSIARVSTDGVNDVVRVVYSLLIEDEGKQYQSARIVDVRVTKIPPSIFAVRAATNRLLYRTPVPGTDQKGGSALWPQFIQADKATAQDPAAATHILRWTEVVHGGTHIERISAWDPSKPWVGSDECPGWRDCNDFELWHRNHDLDEWRCIGECSPGDYQYGAFVQVVDECSYDFFVPWVRRWDSDGDWHPEIARAYAAMVTTTMGADHCPA